MNSYLVQYRYGWLHIELFLGMFMPGLVYTYVLLYQLRGLKSNYTPLAKSTPTAQILVSSTILQEKEKGLFGRNC